MFKPLIIHITLEMWSGRDIIDVLDFRREELYELFLRAKEFEEHKRDPGDILSKKVMALAFFEPSTRTRMSFEAAMLRMGGKTMNFGDPRASSVAKGENLADTVRMLDFYSDVIVIRHWLEGASRFAAEVCSHPIINAGEGMRNHPTQTMIDLYEVWRDFGEIDGIRVAVVGDIKHARASSSFLMGLSLFKVRKIYLVSPDILRARREIINRISESGIEFEERNSLDGIEQEIDVMYVTRVQKERFDDPTEYERARKSYIIDESVIKKMSTDSIILHPLPRVDELLPKVDKYRQAKYFEQARRGLYVRMALLELILSG